MKTSTAIVIQKYYEEIEMLKNALLTSGGRGLRNELFIDIIKFVLNNSFASREQIERFAKHLKVNPDIIQEIFDSFHKSSEINVINFDFPKDLMKETKFDNDGEVIRFILRRLRSPENNSGLFEDLKIEDLVSNESLSKMNDFLRGSLLKTNLMKYFYNLQNEIRSDYEYVEARVRVVDPILMQKGGKYLGGFKEFKHCYIKLMYPLVSLHDIRDLTELITTKIEYLEIKDAQT